MSDINTLPTLSGPEQEPASSQKAKQLVVLLHGLGADGNDLFGLVPYFASALPDAHFVSLDAPYACDMAPYGRQWFSLQVREEEVIVGGLRTVAPILNRYLDEKLEALGLENKDLTLIGFSQGTMLSLFTSLRREPAIAGVLGYSGALMGEKLLDEELKSMPELCLIHGEQDEVVPFEAFQQAMTALQKRGLFVNGYSQEGLGHGIDPAGMQIGCAFLRRVYGLDEE